MNTFVNTRNLQKKAQASLSSIVSAVEVSNFSKG